ncbi:MAG: PAS domain S-box protein [Cytophagales bacterium]|nr:PAS domain S-box protein [Cytophagales bacterium]
MLLQKIRKLLFPEDFLVPPAPGSVSNILWLGQLCYIGVSLFIFGVLFRHGSDPKLTGTLLAVFVTTQLVQYYEYRQRSFEAARYIFYGSANAFLFLFSSFLGSQAGVYLLFFPLISSTVAVYGLADKKKIIVMVLLSFLFLGLLDLTNHQLFVLDLPLATLRLYYVLNFLLSLSFIIFCVSHLVMMNSRTQAVLRESEAKLSSVLDSLDEIVWAVSLPGYQVTYLNTAADRVLQFPDPSFRRDKRKWAQLVHPQDQRRYLAFHENVLNRGAGELEYRITRPNGEIRWLHESCKIIRSGQDHPVRLEGITTDITEQKRTEKMIKQQNEKLQAILESTSSSIFAIDTQYRYLSYNSSHQATMQRAYQQHVSVGMDVRENGHFGPDAESMLGHLGRAMRGETFSVTEDLGEASLHRACYEITFNPIQNESGAVTGVAVFARDITERKQRETELIRTNFELDSFVYRSSHDMRAPLRSILGLVNLIRMEEDPEKHPHLLHLIEKSVNKLDTFILDLMNFSRNSRLSVATEPVDFEKIIADCADNLRYMERADRVRIITDVQSREPFFSDPSRIAIIFQNMLSNSIKYQQTEGVEPYIHIRIRTDQQQAALRIEDNGQGIDEAYIDRIFDMFFRASLDSYGSGLGLYITKQVVEKLGGSIDVSSRPRVGTVFTVTLPNRVPAPTLVEQD